MISHAGRQLEKPAFSTVPESAPAWRHPNKAQPIANNDLISSHLWMVT